MSTRFATRPPIRNSSAFGRRRLRSVECTTRLYSKLLITGFQIGKKKEMFEQKKKEYSARMDEFKNVEVCTASFHLPLSRFSRHFSLPV